MARTFSYSPARIALSAVALLLAPFIRTADAQVSVPGNYASIQSAINAVMSGSLPDGTTIDVQPGTYFEVLSVANTNRSMTVRGVGGAAATIVDAGGRNAPVLNVLRATGQVVFKGLTFRRAATSTEGGGFLIRESSPSLVDAIFESNSAFRGGGGALFSSNATFTRCIIRNNSASHFGGGVYLIQGSRPVFTDTDILGNVSGTGGAGVGNNGAGGGVFSHESSPTFRGSRINANSSKFAAGGLFHQGVFGSSYGRSMLVVEDSELADNVSSQFPGEPNPAEGGGMHVEDNATATLTRVKVLRNRAGTGGGLNAYRGRYDIVDSIIDANQASAGFGGGIGSSSNFASPQIPASIVNLTTTLVRNNSAPLGGGIVVLGDNFSSERASMSLAGSVVSGNQSQTQGGGILVTRTNLTSVNSLIINNSVAGGASPHGGGLLLAGLSAATINTTTIAHNIAGGYGGGIYMDGGVINMSGSQVYANTAAFGGGFAEGPGQSGTIQSSIIADNIGTQANAQIHEDACSSVTYPNNLITLTAFSGCSTLAARAPGTDSTSKPRFAKFLAVPSAGTTTTLAWSAARATSVTIAGVGTWNSPNNSPTGTVDLTPGSSATYTLNASASSANGGNYGAVTAGFVLVVPQPSSLTRHVGDFDGDRKADIAVFRPTSGVWYILRSSTQAGSTVTWGGSGDIPVPGDYDGDGKTDVAVFRPTTGVWYVLRSSNQTGVALTWGGSGDIPVPGDYDGDTKTDIAVFRPSTGVWYIVRSSTQQGSLLTWGGNADVPVPADYDGDGKADVAVFRPSTGAWYIVRSSTQQGTVSAWGGSGDEPVPSDYDGDGKADIAVFRRATGSWFILRSGTQAGIAFTWGGGADVAVPGDYDGDRKADSAVFRPSTGVWYIQRSSSQTGIATTWGGPGDIPI